MTKPKTKVILAGGCFDILHYGHVYFLKKAKSLGDYLVVAIESDERIKELKGKGRPFHSQKQRKETLESLKFVDKVIILKDEMTHQDYIDLVNKVNPCIIAVTEGDPILDKKKEQAEMVGAKIVQIPHIRTHSTTQISKFLNLD